jgi:2-C-methyl-D-erythritol 4-phosphate cytidylyltransferase
VRFGQPKQLVEVAGRPLVAWSLATFASLEEIDDLVIATELEYVERMQDLARGYAPRLSATVVGGGATRQQSARAALAAVPAHCDAAFIHDGARPLVLAADVRAAMTIVKPGIGALIAAPVVDTIKVVERGSTRVSRTLERASLWAAQTPQFGTVADLVRAHEAAHAERFEATDDAMLLERIGVRVEIVAAGGENFKVTHATDRDLAEVLLRERAAAERGRPAPVRP